MMRLLLLFYFIVGFLFITLVVIAAVYVHLCGKMLSIKFLEFLNNRVLNENKSEVVKNPRKYTFLIVL